MKFTAPASIITCGGGLALDVYKRQDEGWLLFYHGVITTCNGFRYAMGAAILDKDHPEKVLYRTREYLLGPAAPYELQGDVPNAVSYTHLL